ncbi:MAG: regulatory iron-sulfur-containing complex subunit RicT [Crocinitomicaceae bacterium]
MGCTNCSTGNGVPSGCKSNGACGTGGCDKLAVYDWLADIELPNGQSTYDIIEVRFKNSRKAFYRNLKGVNLQVGDVVVVEASPGHDVGIVSVAGELARIQVRKKAPNFKAHEARNVVRKATTEDVEKWKDYREREKKTMFKSREIASQLALQMKISDIEYQGDGNKATFYYTAEDRVDFRQLIRSLADEFKVRIEMKQIGVRQEAARLGGIGSCGRELCCSTWLTDFRSVSTASARYQQLSLNPQKLAGQCGKLKCCLNYELDSYVDALKKFPKADIKLQTEKGTAFHVKTDVFKEQMWYIQQDKNNPGPGTFVPLSPERVKEIIALNKEGKKPADLKDFMVQVEVEEPDYTNVVGQDSLNRFDGAFKKKKKKKKKRPGQQQNRNNDQAKAANSNKQHPPKKQGGNKNNRKKNPNQKAKNPNAKKQEGNKPNDKNTQSKPTNKQGQKPNKNKRRKPNPNQKNRPQNKKDDNKEK